jgi:hypothetical protein
MKCRGGYASELVVVGETEFRQPSGGQRRRIPEQLVAKLCAVGRRDFAQEHRLTCGLWRAKAESLTGPWHQGDLEIVVGGLDASWDPAEHQRFAGCSRARLELGTDMEQESCTRHSCLR